MGNKGEKLLLMATRNPVNSPVEGQVVFFPITYRVLAPSKRWLLEISEPSTVCLFFFEKFLWKILGLGSFFEDVVS